MRDPKPRRVRLFRLAVLAVVIASMPYCYDALNRSGARECRRETVENYIGETCYLPNEWGVVFRLYDARSGELLAERSYVDPEVPRLLWIGNDVQYDFNAKDGEGFVTLPPTWLDKLRAKLP